MIFRGVFCTLKNLKIKNSGRRDGDRKLKRKVSEMKLIELCGIFNAGKFNLIGRLKERFSEEGYRTHSIQADRIIPGEFIDRKNYLGRELSILTETIRSVIHVRDAHNADFLFIHRGLWDAIAFFQGLIDGGLISKEQASPGISLAESYTEWIDLVILVEIPIKISIERSCLPGAAIDSIRDEKSLEALFNAYEALKKRLPEGSLVIDGTPRFGTKALERNLDIISGAILSRWDCICSVAIEDTS